MVDIRVSLGALALVLLVCGFCLMFFPDYKKVIALAVFVFLIGFAIDLIRYVHQKDDEMQMFTYVEETNKCKIVYHKETKVMYAVSADSYIFTLLVDADGKPMLWDESEE